MMTVNRVFTGQLGEILKPYEDFLHQTVKDLNLAPDKTVLDIGTGWGMMAIALATYELNVITGQPAREMMSEEEDNHDHEHHDHEMTIDQSKMWDVFNDFTERYTWEDHANRLGLVDRIVFKLFDARDLPFDDEGFDAIFLYDTLHHITSERKKAVSELKRVCKPGGIICIIETNERGTEIARDLFGMELHGIDPRDYFLTEAFELREIIGERLTAFIFSKISST